MGYGYGEEERVRDPRGPRDPRPEDDDRVRVDDRAPRGERDPRPEDPPRDRGARGERDPRPLVRIHTLGLYTVLSEVYHCEDTFTESSARVNHVPSFCIVIALGVVASDWHTDCCCQHIPSASTLILRWLVQDGPRTRRPRGL